VRRFGSRFIAEKMSQREAARQFGLVRERGGRCFVNSVAGGVPGQQAVFRSKLNAWAGVIDQIV
jgi:hypothetical protein